MEAKWATLNKHIKDKEVEVRKLEAKKVALTKRVTKSKSGMLGDKNVKLQPPPRKFLTQALLSPPPWLMTGSPGPMTSSASAVTSS